jgi:hypothetical protein
MVKKNFFCLGAIALCASALILWGGACLQFHLRPAWYGWTAFGGGVCLMAGFILRLRELGK